MGTLEKQEKPHAVCIPYPAQGHIGAMLKLAKLLYSRGFFITFVNTDFNHRRLQKSTDLVTKEVVEDFRFETIPDGLPWSDLDATQNIPALSISIKKNGLPHFKDLLLKLMHTPGTPPISCIVSDGVMSFTLDAAEELGIPEVLFWPISAGSFMGCLHFEFLIQKGFVPLRDVADLTNGYLDTTIDSIPGLDAIRLKDLPSFIQTTESDDVMLEFVNDEAQRACKAAAVILNTFDALENNIVEALKSMLPRVYTVGPFSKQVEQISDENLNSLSTNLWKEDAGWEEWLDKKEKASVVYVNFGSIAVLSSEQMGELAWGLLNSEIQFLWVIRPDLLIGEWGLKFKEFEEMTRDRGLILNWVHQERLLAHQAIGGFLTHCGWNSMLESICSGVPLLCWPFFADQQTNSWLACTKWGIGMKLDHAFSRVEVEVLVKDLMAGEKGKMLRKRAQEWKKLALEATLKGGSSHLNLEKILDEVLCVKS